MKASVQTTFSSIKNQLKQNVIAITSLLVALTGLTANISYMEHKERNSNLRTASFQVLIELSALEQITFHLQYDTESAINNARNGWVKVRLVSALSALMPEKVQLSSLKLSKVWKNNWQLLGNNNQLGSDTIIEQISHTRELLISLIATLE